jgi:hypothetical protein
MYGRRSRERRLLGVLGIRRRYRVWVPADFVIDVVDGSKLSRYLRHHLDVAGHEALSASPSCGRGLSYLALSSLVALGLSSCSDKRDRAQLAYTRSGSPLHWKAKEVVLTPAPERRGETPPARLQQALSGAAAAWNRALAGCRAPRLLANRQTLVAPALGDDRVNAVIIHEKSWCPATSVQREDCYAADSQAHTLLYPNLQPGSPHDGELRGVDVEVNAVDFIWSSEGMSGDLLSLQTILMHELGHTLGLDHPCGPTTEWSNKRRPLLACDPNAPVQVMRSDIASISKGQPVTPTRGEVAALCDLYRTQDD